MTLYDLPLLRLRRQQLSMQNFEKSEDLVAWMGAMQAQDHNMVRWAIALRLPCASQRTIQSSIDKGTLIRTHVMRPTWHLIPAEDATWMLELTAPRIRASIRSRLHELELTPQVLNKGLNTLEKALGSGLHLTRDELFEQFEKNKLATYDQRAAHILLWAELEKVICSGAMRGKKNTYALFDLRVTDKKKLTPEEALTTLAMRYFQSHGPATVQDFTNWSGLPGVEVKKALEFMRGDFVSEKIDSQVYWFKNGITATKNHGENSVYLLPAFDEYIIGYRDRRAYLPGKGKPAVIASNGMLSPVMVVNGMVTGLWKRTFVRNRVNVELKFFTKTFLRKNKDINPSVQEAVEKVSRFFEET